MAAPVRLSDAVDVADGHAARFDLSTANPLHHARVVRVVACSAVNRPFFPYSPAAPLATGCHSPGYGGGQLVYQDSNDTASQTPLDSRKFRIRQTGRSLFVRKRLLDAHSPLVHLQVWVRLQDEFASRLQNGAAGDDWPLHGRYVSLERAIPLDQALPAREVADRPLETGLAAKVFDRKLLSDGRDAQDDPIRSATPSAVPAGRPWGWIAIGAMGVAMMAGVFYVAVLKKTRHPVHASYAEQRKRDETGRIRDWIGNAVLAGVFSSSHSQHPGECH